MSGKGFEAFKTDLRKELKTVFERPFYSVSPCPVFKVFLKNSSNIAHLFFRVITNR